MTSVIHHEAAVSSVTQQAVEGFVYQEARLADEARYDEWLALWADGAVLYWVPPSEDTDPAREVSLIYDDRARLEQRVARWTSGFAWSQDPASRTIRVLGNIEAELGDEGDVHVRCNVITAVSRNQETSTLASRTGYRLRPTVEDGLRMVEKRVVLLDPQAPVGNVTFVL